MNLKIKQLTAVMIQFVKNSKPGVEWGLSLASSLE